MIFSLIKLLLPFWILLLILYAYSYTLHGIWQVEDAFFRDHAESHKKLSELGFDPSSSWSNLVAKSSTILAQSVIGVEVAVAAAVVIVSYIYEVGKRMKWSYA